MKMGKIAPLLLAILLILPSFFVSPVFATDSANWFTIDYRYSNQGVYGMPGGGTFTQYSGTWALVNGTGARHFNGLSDRGFGTFIPHSSMANFTFIIEFFHQKASSGNPTECLASIYFENWLGPLASQKGNYLVVGLTEADTDYPHVFYYIGAAYDDALHDKQMTCEFGRINNNEWYTLKLTYCNNTKQYQAYLNNFYWSRGNYTIPTLAWGSQIWLKSGQSYIYSVGAYPEPLTIEGFGDYFNGYIHYSSLTDGYTTPFAGTEIALWYHFDEGDSGYVTDYSGNGMTGTVNTGYWQAITGGISGTLALGGTDNYVNAFGVTLPTNIPSITTKFSCSMWIKLVDHSYFAVWESDVFYGKTLKFWFDGAAGDEVDLTCSAMIGGSQRNLKKVGVPVNSTNPYWLYLYSQYDGSTFRFAGVWSTGQVYFNLSSTISGTISDYGYKHGTDGPYGFAYGTGNTAYHTHYYIDEFKLTSQTLGPYEMNTTSFGEGLVYYPVNDSSQIDAYLSPNSIVCYPTAAAPYGLGTTTMYINSTDAWTINLTTPSLNQYFDISPDCVNIAETEGPVINLGIAFTFIANNKTKAGNFYSGEYLLTLTGKDMFRTTVPFSLSIYTAPPEGRNQSSFETVWSKSPLVLWWNTDLQDSNILYASDETTGLPISFDVQSLGFRYTTYKARAYNDTFVRYWNIEEHIIYPQGTPCYEFTYGIDENVKTYGNFTVYHRLKVYNRLNPNDVVYIENRIDVYSPLVTKKIWCVVSPSTITDYGNVSNPATLYLYANYQTQLSWSTANQSGTGWESWYIHVYGSPPSNAIVSVNSSIDLRVVMPMAIGTHQVNLVVYDVKDPSYSNHTTLYTITNSVSGVDFTFYIKPVDVYFDMAQVVGTPHVTGQLYCTNSHVFYLSIAKTSYFNGLTVTYPASLGSTSSSSPAIGPIDISFAVDASRIGNGDLPVEFDAYYVASDGSKPFVAAVVTVHVKNAKGTGGVGPDGVIVTNMTTITPSSMFQVTGMGSGLFRDSIGAMAGYIGWPFDAMAFFIGLIFIVLAMVGIAILTKGGAPALVYIFVGFPLVVFNGMIGLWSPWIAIAMVIFGVGLLSLRLGRFVMGKSEGEQE